MFLPHWLRAILSLDFGEAAVEDGLMRVAAVLVFVVAVALLCLPIIQLMTGVMAGFPGDAL
jgi:hypothetical protein